MPEAVTFKSVGFGHECIVFKAFNPDEERDAEGKWTSGGGDTSEGQMTVGAKAETWQDDKSVNYRQRCKKCDEFMDNNCTGIVLSSMGGSDLEDTRGVTGPQVKALEGYSDGDYQFINEGLRDGEIVLGAKSEADEKQATAIQAAIDKNTVGQQYVGFRGIGDSKLAKQIAGMAPGQTFSDNAFVSTSLVADVARGFAGASNVEFHITVPSGSHAVGLAGEEGEILLGGGSTFRIDAVRSGTGRELKTVVEATYIGADPYKSGKLKKAARSKVKSQGKFTWSVGDITFHPAPNAKKAVVFKSVGFGQETIMWKAPKPARINWADHPDHAIHAAIVAYYGPKLAEAMRASVSGIHQAIAAAQRNYATATKAAPSEPTPADNAAQDAVRANVSISNQQTLAVLRQMLAASALAATYNAAVQIGAGAKVLNGLEDVAAEINWDAWEPGWAEAADLARFGGLRTLLNAAKVTIKYMDDNSIDRIGNTLADGLADGSPVQTIANNMLAVVTNNMTGPDGEPDPNLLAPPDRAFLIANTEASRAMSEAAVDTYAANGIAKWEWLAEDDDRTCDECEGNNQQEFEVGGDDPRPPAHPRCRCVVLPVVDLSDVEVPAVVPDDEAPDDEAAAKANVGELVAAKAFNPDEPRGADGRWGATNTETTNSLRSLADVATRQGRDAKTAEDLQHVAAVHEQLAASHAEEAASMRQAAEAARADGHPGTADNLERTAAAHEAAASAHADAAKSWGAAQSGETSSARSASNDAYRLSTQAHITATDVAANEGKAMAAEARAASGFVAAVGPSAPAGANYQFTSMDEAVQHFAGLGIAVDAAGLTAIGTTPEHMSTIANAVSDMNDKYPGVTDELTRIQAAPKAGNGVMSEITASRAGGDTTLNVTPYACRVANDPAYAAAIYAAADRFANPSGPLVQGSVYDLYAHEMGHVVQRMPMADGQRALGGVLRATGYTNDSNPHVAALMAAGYVSEKGTLRTAQIKKDLAEYASRNNLEFHSEMVALFNNPEKFAALAPEVQAKVLAYQKALNEAVGTNVLKAASSDTEADTISEYWDIDWDALNRKFGYKD